MLTGAALLPSLLQCAAPDASNNNITCAKCVPGRYSTDGFPCLSCPSGQYSSLLGASSCIDCPSATFSDFPGGSDATTCKPCSGFFNQVRQLRVLCCMHFDSAVLCTPSRASLLFRHTRTPCSHRHSSASARALHIPTHTV